MNKTIIANIFSLIGAFLLGISTFSNNKKNMLLIQTGDCTFNAIACLFAGSYTGFTTNALSGIRNIFNAKGKVTKPLIAIFSIMILAVGLVPLYLSYVSTLNNIENNDLHILHYLLQVLPPVASVQYTIWSSVAKSAQRIRIGLLLNISMWIIHDFGMKLYPAFIMDVIIISITIINFFRNKE